MSISAQSVVRIRTHVGHTDNSLRVSGRRTILARTSHLHLYLRKWMRHKAWECWLHRCQVQPQQEFTTPTDKILRHAHHTFKSRGKLVEMYSHKRKSSRDPKSLQGSFLDREKYSREIRDFLELRADRAAQEEQAAFSRLSEAEYHTILMSLKHDLI